MSPSVLRYRPPVNSDLPSRNQVCQGFFPDGNPGALGRVGSVRLGVGPKRVSPRVLLGSTGFSLLVVLCRSLQAVRSHEEGILQVKDKPLVPLVFCYRHVTHTLPPRGRRNPCTPPLRSLVLFAPLGTLYNLPGSLLPPVLFPLLDRVHLPEDGTWSRLYTDPK